MNLDIIKTLDARVIYKNILNILAVIIALIVMKNIYNNQNKNVLALRDKADIEAKSNVALADIRQMEGLIAPYRKLFSNKDVSFIVNVVSSMADKLGIKVVSLSPEKAKSAPPFTRYPFILTVTGDNYHSIGKFVNLIESFDTVYLTIDSVDMKQEAVAAVEGARKKITANIGLSSVVLEK